MATIAHTHFEVGDVVIIHPLAKVGNYYGGLPLLEGPMAFEGTREVTDIGGGFSIELSSGYFYRTEMLMLAEEEVEYIPMMSVIIDDHKKDLEGPSLGQKEGSMTSIERKFNVGDEVRATSDRYGITSKSNGWTGTVTDAMDGYFAGKTVSCDTLHNGTYSNLDYADFELAEVNEVEAPLCPFKVGDIVVPTKKAHYNYTNNEKSFVGKVHSIDEDGTFRAIQVARDGVLTTDGKTPFSGLLPELFILVHRHTETHTIIKEQEMKRLLAEATATAVKETWDGYVAEAKKEQGIG